MHSSASCRSISHGPGRPADGKTVSVTPNHARPGQRHAGRMPARSTCATAVSCHQPDQRWDPGGDPLPTLPTMDLLFEPPTVDEYVRLRREAGLTVRKGRRDRAEELLVVGDRAHRQAGRGHGPGDRRRRLVLPHRGHGHPAGTSAQRHRSDRPRCLAAADSCRSASGAVDHLFADPAGVALYRAAGFVPNGCQGMELPPRGK